MHRLTGFEDDPGDQEIKFKDMLPADVQKSRTISAFMGYLV